MENKIIFTKQDLRWHILNEYLQSIKALVATTDDKELNKILQDMQNFINKKLKLATDEDVSDLFVLILQKPQK